MRNSSVMAASLPVKQKNAHTFKLSQDVRCLNGSVKQVVPYASSFLIDVYNCRNVARARNTNSLFIHSLAL